MHLAGLCTVGNLPEFALIVAANNSKESEMLEGYIQSLAIAAIGGWTIGYIIRCVQSANVGIESTICLLTAACLTAVLLWFWSDDLAAWLMRLEEEKTSWRVTLHTTVIIAFAVMYFVGRENARELD